LGDDKIHVVAATLQNSLTIEELQFRKNNNSDDGAGAIAAVLAEPIAIKSIDLHGDNIGMMCIKAIAEAWQDQKEYTRYVFTAEGLKL
jgi:hypothetical protein